MNPINHMFSPRQYTRTAPSNTSYLHPPTHSRSLFITFDPQCLRRTNMCRSAA